MVPIQYPFSTQFPAKVSKLRAINGKYSSLWIDVSALTIGDYLAFVPWSNGNDASLTKRKRGFDSLRDDFIPRKNSMVRGCAGCIPLL
jgi:hypothetical protein